MTASFEARRRALNVARLTGTRSACYLTRRGPRQQPRGVTCRMPDDQTPHLRETMPLASEAAPAHAPAHDADTARLRRPVPVRNLSLTVLRAPLADMEADDDEPEIPARYHRDLIDWCCHLAYLLRDSDTESFQRATAFEQRFTQRFGPRLSARDHARLSRNPSTQLRPPPGSRQWSPAAAV